MKNVRYFVACSLSAALLACGNSEKGAPAPAPVPPPTSLALAKTSWYLSLGQYCTYGLNFNTDVEYSQWTVCMEGNVAYFEGDFGRYTTTSDSITLAPARSTCKGVQGGGYDSAQVTAKAVMKAGVSLIILSHLQWQKLDDTISNVQAIYGCFVGEDFVESAIK